MNKKKMYPRYFVIATVAGISYFLYYTKYFRPCLFIYR